MRQLLPPLGILVVITHQRLVLGVPWVSLRDVLRCGSHADTQWGIHGLIASSCPTDVGQVVATFIGPHLVGASPVIINERRKAAALVLVPVTGARFGEGKYATECLPMQQVVAFRQPRFVTSAVGTVLAVIAYVGHIPSVSFTKHSRAVYLVVVIHRCYDKAVLIGCTNLIVDMLHRLLCGVKQPVYFVTRTLQSYIARFDVVRGKARHQNNALG